MLTSYAPVCCNVTVPVEARDQVLNAELQFNESIRVKPGDALACPAPASKDINTRNIAKMQAFPQLLRSMTTLCSGDFHYLMHNSSHEIKSFIINGLSTTYKFS